MVVLQDSFNLLIPIVYGKLRLNIAIQQNQWYKCKPECACLIPQHFNYVDDHFYPEADRNDSQTYMLS